MKRYSPPSLVDLASQSFLKDEASAIAMLHCLPIALFLPLFKAAVTGRHLATLKAMVSTWPFTCLPLGALIGAQQLPQDILKAVLDGLDVLLAQKVRPGRCQLKVLDLCTHAHSNSWNLCSDTESDFTYLSLCPSTKSLRSLNLSRIKLTGFNPQSLQVLLERTSDTLQILNLGGCGITDSQLKAILPALGRCSQLELFRLYGIPVSMATLEGLLRHTLPLCKLQLLQFPIPLECYLDIQGPLQQGKLPMYMAKLKQTLQDLGKWNRLLACQHDTNIDDHSITCIIQD
ncbi:melanoma antigen preferentially expressed in tumors-like [Echinops telfairi]|uniref:Melanoma antigen preferentially expressed in tumors-like n=1 Tax=Echinops telfairi TaxID=9371 RepID=A0AC55CMD8_ECHTE|nr:melanoma antigen preferentially expressed in tumors-like [Echinops telfairi]